MPTHFAPSFSRISRRMAVFCGLLFWALLPALVIYVSLLPDPLTQTGWTIPELPAARPFPVTVRLVVMVALGLGALPGLWGLWNLRALFRGYAEGVVFSTMAARRLRRCGLAVFAAGLLAPVGSALLSVALTFDLPPGSRVLTFSYSLNDLTLTIVGGVLMIIAQVMLEAARLSEENDGFV